MKKFLSIALFVFLCLNACFCISCSKNVSGTYKFVSLTKTNGQEETLYEIEDAYSGSLGETIISQDFLTLELKEDNTFFITNKMGDNLSTLFGGKWEQKDDEIVLIPDGNACNPLVFTIENKTITFNNVNTILVMQKI